MVLIRDYQPRDAAQVDALALRAFDEFRNDFVDWPAFRKKIANMSALGSLGEIIVAEADGEIAGAVVYIGPGAPKAEFFRPEWSVMRMLVVSPEARGRGIGRILAEECLRRAKRDGAPAFALHTSELMKVALPMYQRMGFHKVADGPAIHGVAYGIYVKDLGGAAECTPG